MPPSLFQETVSEDLLPVMSSVTCSCLEALTHFFSDELSKGGMGGMPFECEGEHCDSIAALMCSTHMIDAIKMAASFLPRGVGRLAALRVVSALTERPVCTNALNEVILTPIHSYTHTLTLTLIHSPIHSYTHTLIHPYTHTYTHTLTHTPTHTLIHSPIHLSVFLS
ncbi:hypothetical protein B484DRAFT_65024 [Ochromonadaceae sp. CCMP2298]|nr:hypothetical protein B484DRAFT_65024 [Ochromonadaceae sp. CCMP2298]